MPGWPTGMMRRTDVDAVRAALAAVADPNARLGATRNTPTHDVLWELGEAAEVGDLLIAHGADVEPEGRAPRLEL